ncbi:MAG: CBS domain-containing protein [Deltaproteobacteria bacterium]|nr:CBS domain-containing protein [Deltaproteobacteria bacterium]MBW1951517.1 CBS domain-containing protein [Deltaproteobacteria bacterium]MBW1986285.1 CBS domain-containing protein [Deltaproteobacteria bacterium]MBW2134326.1 CBS domain-containing protein [Deltaproteobacteria bacterium]
MLQARDIMTRQVITIAPQASVLELARLLADSRISGVPVVDAEGRVIGVATQSDLIDRAKRFDLPHVITILDAHIFLETPGQFKKKLEKLLGSTVADVMTADPITITGNMPVDEIATLMANKKVHTLPVIEDGKLIGIIGKIDIVRSLSQEG